MLLKRDLHFMQNNRKNLSVVSCYLRNVSSYREICFLLFAVFV